VIIEGNSISADETPSDDFLEHELKELMAEGHALSSVHIPLNSMIHFKLSIIFWNMRFCLHL
jgi:hypothetical protein